MTGKYEPLHQHLVADFRRGDDAVQLSFAELDTLVCGLPASARNYREWWANSGQPHSWSWRDAGWRVAKVDQVKGFVRFERSAQAGARPTAGSPKGAPAPRTTKVVIDAGSLPVLERSETRVEFEWRDAGLIALDAKGAVLFPRLPPASGIYRMTFTGAPSQKRPRVYVGESDDLRRRAAHYRNPGPTQDTNIRLNAALKAHVAAGRTVRLAIATSARVSNGTPGSSALDLSRKASRLLVENAVLVATQLAGNVEIENLE